MALRRPVSARLVALAALAGGTPALLLATAAVAEVSESDQAASVIEITREDRVEDLRSFGGRVASASARRRLATDLLSATVRLDRAAGVVEATWRLRDLRRLGGIQFAGVHAQTDGGTHGEGPIAIVDLHSRRVVAVDEMSARRCPAATVRVGWQRDLVRASLPFACLGADEAARVRLVTMSLPMHHPPALFDQAPLTRALPFTRLSEQPTTDEPATDQPAGAAGAPDATDDRAMVDAARVAARSLR